MNDFLTRFRILPLLVLVAMAAFAVRIGDTFLGVRNMAASVMAEEAALDVSKIEPASGDKAEEKAAEKADEKAKETKDEKTEKADGKGEKSDAATAGKPKVNLPDETLPEVWADPGAENMADSPEQMELLEDLAARRQELDAREKSLLNKEALLKATEKQIDEKITELTGIKGQIEALLGQQDAQETAKIKSLVKIYEGMKAKDAADIFNQMDMDIMVQVVSNMSERKSAPIMAAMDRTRANQLTVMLTEMKKLPKANPAGPIPTSAPAGSAALPGLDALGAP